MKNIFTAIAALAISAFSTTALAGSALNGFYSIHQYAWSDSSPSPYVSMTYLSFNANRSFVSQSSFSGTCHGSYVLDSANGYLSLNYSGNNDEMTLNCKQFSSVIDIGENDPSGLPVNQARFAVLRINTNLPKPLFYTKPVFVQIIHNQNNLISSSN